MKNSTRFATSIFAGLALTLGARAQEIRLGGEFQVNTYTPGAERYAAVASDADGDFVVVWGSSAQDGPDAGVFGRRFSKAGAALATEFQVNTYTTGNESYPSASMDADGDFVVVWTSSVQDGGDYGIFARLFSSAGTALGSDFQINSRTSLSQLSASVAREASGAFVVAWASQNQDNSGSGIFARRLTTTGGVLGVEFQVNSHTTLDQLRPAIASDADGDFVVVWQSGFQEDTSYGIFGRRFTSTGTALAAEFQVNVYTEGDQKRAAVAMDADGDFVVVWQSKDQDGSSYGVFARRFSSSGIALTGDVAVNTFVTAAQEYPAVSSAADGDFVVTWQSLNQDGLLYSIFARRFSSTGFPVAPEFEVNTYTTGVQITPAIASDASGHIVIAWHSLDQDGQSYGVFAQRFAAQIAGDIDGNGVTDPLTDGLLFLRYLFGFRGATLVTGAVAGGCTRCDAPSIEAYLAGLAG